MQKEPSQQHLEDLQEGIISHITNDTLAVKLLSMGIAPGKKIKIIRKAPFNGGFYVEVDDRQRIAIRKEEAQCIMLQV